MYCCTSFRYDRWTTWRTWCSSRTRGWCLVDILKDPCLVLVIEWQLRQTNKCLCWDTQVIIPHKDTSMSNMCHGGEMAKGWCYAHIVWWRNSLHMRHDMESCDQSGEDQENAWLDGPVAMVKGKSILWSNGPRGGEAWVRLGTDGPMWRWRASKVKIDEPKRSCDDMEWIISFMIVFVHWLHRHLEDGVDEWRQNRNAQGKGMTCSAFYFTSLRLSREVLDRI